MFLNLFDNWTFHTSILENIKGLRYIHCTLLVWFQAVYWFAKARRHSSSVLTFHPVYRYWSRSNRQLVSWCVAMIKHSVDICGIPPGTNHPYLFPACDAFFSGCKVSPWRWLFTLSTDEDSIRTSEIVTSLPGFRYPISFCNNELLFCFESACERHFPFCHL